MIKLTGIDGHIVLYCKYHYKSDVPFLLGLRRIWAIRCGLENQYVEKGQADQHIADHLYELMTKLNPNKASYLHELMHKAICNEVIYSGFNVIERLIMFYRSEIAFCETKKKNESTGNYESIVELPAPNVDLFVKIIEGRGEYSDYNLIDK